VSDLVEVTLTVKVVQIGGRGRVGADRLAAAAAEHVRRDPVFEVPGRGAPAKAAIVACEPVEVSS
jgi:hypothetical protein